MIPGGEPWIFHWFLPELASRTVRGLVARGIGLDVDFFWDVPICESFGRSLNRRLTVNGERWNRDAQPLWEMVSIFNPATFMP